MITKRKVRTIFAFLARSGHCSSHEQCRLEGSPSLSHPVGREPCPFRLANPQKRHALSFWSGASLLETVLYVGIFAVITLLTVNTVLALTRAMGEMRTLRHTIQDSEIAMERMIREIRAAEIINTTASIFNTHPGKLVLTGTSSTITFSLVGGEQLFFQKNTNKAAPLTSSSTAITNLVFTHLIASSSEAVRIRMVMDNKNFYGTAVLRTNYK